MIKCQKCDRDISDEVMFCPYCGSKVNQNDSTDVNAMENEDIKESSTSIENEPQENISKIEEPVLEKKTEQETHTTEVPANHVTTASNNTKSSFDLLVSNKKQLAAFILSALTALFTLIYLFKVSPSNLMLIYTMLLLAGSSLLTIYNFQTSKKIAIYYQLRCMYLLFHF